MQTAARTADGRLVWALVDAHESRTLVVDRVELVALNATATVRADFREHVVPSDRVTSIDPYGEGPAPPELQAMFALVYALRPGSRDALLVRLGAPAVRSPDGL